MISPIGLSLPRLEIGGAAPLGESPAALAARTGAGADFSAVMQKVAGDAMGALRSAEMASLEGVRGNASTQAVVDAVMNAERTLQTAVAMREKVVSAYLELSRMAI